MQRNSVPVSWPMASMADIAFLLIIFFMITSVISSDQGLSHEFLPDEIGDPLPALELQVFDHGYLLAGVPYANDHDLTNALDDHMNINANRAVILIANDDASYQQFIYAIDAIERVERRHPGQLNIATYLQEASSK